MNRQTVKNAKPAKTEKTNIVIFYADDFGWGDIRHHNTDPALFRYTPNMDRLFTEGIEFKNYMPHCVCSPSRAGLLTGKHYANVGAGPRTGGTLPSNSSIIADQHRLTSCCINELCVDLHTAGFSSQ